MRYVAAYLLAVLGGNESPDSKDLKKILSSVGIEAEDVRMDKVIKELNGKKVQDVIDQGYSKLSCLSTGGATAVSSSAGAAATASTGGATPAAAEEKKEEKKEESEESDGDMGFGLFD
ncbi:RLA2 protein, partial [Polypterus senegalus]|nr:60S acidic ribosomal protein P2-like [Polypterus senegalus]MBN3289522.1 RLA2 protein [Polypterus senegalus]